MARGIGHGQTFRTSGTLRVDPRIILASQILELNQAELEQAVDSELNENPALERIDDRDPAPSMEEILKVVAPRELWPMGECNELARSTPRDAGNEVDWVDLASSNDTLWDHLRAQVSQRLDRSLWELGEYLVASVNERGYLMCDPEEAALECGCSLEDALEGINHLQACEPAGVGAKDIRECLYLQLRGATTDEEKLARLVLKNDWEALIQRNVKAIRKRYKVTTELVEGAIACITSLNPFPGEGFEAASTTQVQRSITAQPDVILRRDEQGWSVEVQGPSVMSLRIDRAYESRYQALENKGGGASDEKRHVFEFVDRARRFMDAVSQRRRLMAEIGRYLLEKQHGFVSTGEVKFLCPLTRSQLASDLGSHESTVSRATSGKFVQIATGEVISFDLFFKPALRVQKLIEDILGTENPDSPLSDESIARILEQQGVKVARRTVNKYRDRTKLLSSRRRKIA